MATDIKEIRLSKAEYKVYEMIKAGFKKFTEMSDDQFKHYIKEYFKDSAVLLVAAFQAAEEDLREKKRLKDKEKYFKDAIAIFKAGFQAQEDRREDKRLERAKWLQMIRK